MNVGRLSNVLCLVHRPSIHLWSLSASVGPNRTGDIKHRLLLPDLTFTSTSTSTTISPSRLSFNASSSVLHLLHLLLSSFCLLSPFVSSWFEFLPLWRSPTTRHFCSLCSSCSFTRTRHVGLSIHVVLCRVSSPQVASGHVKTMDKVRVASDCGVDDS